MDSSIDRCPLALGGNQRGYQMIQALYCQNGDHVYERDATRGRQPTSCQAHGGTGIARRTYRTGSRNGEAALAANGGTIKGRVSAGTKAKEYRQEVKAGKPVVPLAPREVPVRLVKDSETGDSKASRNAAAVERALARVRSAPVIEEDGYLVQITLSGRGGYKPETTVQEQRTLLAKLATDDKKMAVSTQDTKSGEHDLSKEFWCEPGGHWAARKSNRGRAPRVCDEHKDENYQRERASEYRANSATRGEEIAAGLDERLRAGGVHLSQQGQEFEVQFKWAGKWNRFLILHGAQSRKLWLAKEDNAKLVTSGKFRIVSVKAAA